MLCKRNPIFRKAPGLLILKVVALGPVHGYAIAQRLEQWSRGVVRFRRARSIRVAPARKPWPSRADWEENGERAWRPSFIASLGKATQLERKLRAGTID